MERPLAWLQQLPPVTRALICGILAAEGAEFFRLVAEEDLTFVAARTFAGEVWRPVTSLLYFGRLEVFQVVRIFLLGAASASLEITHRHGSVSYAWSLLVMMALALAMSALLDIKLPSQIVIHALPYIRSRREHDNHFMFMNVQLPLMLMVCHTLVSNAKLTPSFLYSELGGLAVGYVIFYLEDIFPLTSGYELLAPPRVFVELFRGDDDNNEAPPAREEKLLDTLLARRRERKAAAAAATLLSQSTATPTQVHASGTDYRDSSS